jgi:hypothetical protein
MEIPWATVAAKPGSAITARQWMAEEHKYMEESQ